MKLSTDQEAAADKFMEFLFDDHEHEMAIVGHSGTGKTTLTKELLKLARNTSKLNQLITNNDNELKVVCAATTNKAAKVLCDKLGEDTSTIHNLLGLKVINNFKTGKTNLKKSANYTILENTLVIIDEASMIDRQLLDIIRESTMDCKVLYIGDSYQLAPVFETTCPVFKEVQNQAVLTTIKRQKKGSPIITEGEKFREAVLTNQFQDIEPDGCAIRHVSGTDFKRLMEEEYTRPNRVATDALVMAWTNSRVLQYNSFIRALTTSEEAYTVGELVVTNKPILSSKSAVVYSTDSTARVTRIYESRQHDVDGYSIDLDGVVTVFVAKDPNIPKALLKHAAKEKDWSEYFAIKDFYADLRPVHASTIHKAQGSTHKTVFIDLSDVGRNNKPNEVARLLYVAITRASHKVVLYGSLPGKYTS
jgi:exodeoxyribonuclease-5